MNIDLGKQCLGLWYMCVSCGYMADMLGDMESRKNVKSTN